MAKKPKPGSVAGYIARKTDKGWVVAFGRLDEEKAKYLIAYEASQGDSPDEFAVRVFDPPKADTGFFPRRPGRPRPPSRTSPSTSKASRGRTTSPCSPPTRVTSGSISSRPRRSPASGP